MVPCHDAAHQRTLSPNVVKNLHEVEEDVDSVHSQGIYSNSPIVPKNLGLDAGFGGYTEQAKVSVSLVDVFEKTWRELLLESFSVITVFLPERSNEALATLSLFLP